MTELEIRQISAQRRIQAFERKFGRGALKLASYASLPIVFNRKLLHLIRTHFFTDGSDISDTAEPDLLLSRLCWEIDDHLYQMEPIVRDILLKRFVTEYSDEELRQMATLLLEYTERESPWGDWVWLGLGQKLTAWNVLDPQKVKEWSDWSRAMHKEAAQLTKIIRQEEPALLNEEALL